MLYGYGHAALSRRLKARKLRLGLSVLLPVSISLFFADSHSGAGNLAATRPSTSLEVAKAYMQAVHARDFNAAYAYISSADRKFLDKRSYLIGQRALNGFALELARWFAAEMKFRVIEERSESHRSHLHIAYVIPSGDEIAAQVLDWNPERLNALAQTNQSQMIQRLENLKKQGKMITAEGRETIEILREEQTWKVYENWRSRQRFMFEASTAVAPALDVQFLRNEILVKTDEPFQVEFTVANRAQHELWVRVQHSFSPPGVEKKIDMIACGSRMPFRLDAGEVRSIASVYLFRPNITVSAPMKISYRFASAPHASLIRNPAIRSRQNG